MVKLDIADIQGIIVSGYKHLKCSSYHFLKFANAARAREWLGSIITRVTTADWERDGTIKKPQLALNVAFTCEGLKSLGLPLSALQTFSQEFYEGMNEAHRAIRLGDVGAAKPESWEFGGPGHEIHALLVLQAPDQPKLNALVGEEVTHYEQFGIVPAADPINGEIADDEREHFGFRDNISQPLIEGAPNHDSNDRDVIKAGEFVLGYLNEYHVFPPSPSIHGRQSINATLKLPKTEAGEIDIGKNGSYFVVRKVLQDVPAFNRFVKTHAKDDPEDRAWLSAKMVGRWQSGAPLVLSPNADNPGLKTNNDFSYLPTDQYGYACPLGAHVRRSNPRDSLVPTADESYHTVRKHRILRRGVSFGNRLVPQDSTTDDQVQRGLLFMCVAADIERQFEFVQQTWINDPKFNGLSNERDPLVGPNLDDVHSTDENATFTIQGEPVRRRVTELQRFVTLKGGAYFFLPSINSLGILSKIESIEVIE